jgi:hypothetical protein
VAKWTPARFADGEALTAEQIAIIDGRIAARLAERRAAADPYPITDAMRERCAVAREEWLMRLDSTMHRNRVELTEDEAAAIADAMEADPHFDAAAEAYNRMKRRLGTPKARRPKQSLFQKAGSMRNAPWQE